MQRGHLAEGVRAAMVSTFSMGIQRRRWQRRRAFPAPLRSCRHFWLTFYHRYAEFLTIGNCRGTWHAPSAWTGSTVSSYRYGGLRRRFRRATASAWTLASCRGMCRGNFARVGSTTVILRQNTGTHAALVEIAVNCLSRSAPGCCPEILVVMIVLLRFPVRLLVPRCLRVVPVDIVPIVLGKICVAFGPHINPQWLLNLPNRACHYSHGRHTLYDVYPA